MDKKFACIPVLILAYCVFSCGSHQQAFRADARIDTLKLWLDISPRIPKFVRNGFDNELELFIEQHNREAHKFKIGRAHSASDNNTISIKVHEMHLVTPKQQTTGAVVSILGLSLPFFMIAAESPIYIFFYYFPRVKTVTETSISDDVKGSIVNPQLRMHESPGFLRSIDKQQTKHVDLFDRYYLKSLIRGLEKSYKPL